MIWLRIYTNARIEETDRVKEANVPHTSTKRTPTDSNKQKSITKKQPSLTHTNKHKEIDLGFPRRVRILRRESCRLTLQCCTLSHRCSIPQLLTWFLGFPRRETILRHVDMEVQNGGCCMVSKSGSYRDDCPTSLSYDLFAFSCAM